MARDAKLKFDLVASLKEGMRAGQLDVRKRPDGLLLVRRPDGAGTAEAARVIVDPVTGQWVDTSQPKTEKGARGWGYWSLCRYLKIEFMDTLHTAATRSAVQIALIPE